MSTISAAVPLIAPLHFSRPIHATQMQVSNDRATASVAAQANTPPRLASPFTSQRPIPLPTHSQTQTQTQLQSQPYQLGNSYTQPIREVHESTEQSPAPDSAPATITTFATPRLSHPQPNAFHATPPSDPWLPRGQLDSSVTYSSPEPMFGTPTPHQLHAQLHPRSRGYIFASPPPPHPHVYAQPMYVGMPAGGDWDDGYGVRVEVDEEIRRTRRHVCPVCDKRFNRPSSLKTHMSVHTGAKPYVCARLGCGRRFSVSSNLRRHEKTHFKQTNTDSENFDAHLQSEGVSLDHDDLQFKTEPEEDHIHTHPSHSPSIDPVGSQPHPDDSVEWWRQSEGSDTADHRDSGSHQRTLSAGSSGTALQSIPVTPGKDADENRATHFRSTGYEGRYRHDADRVASSVLSSLPASGHATAHEHPGFSDTRSASCSSRTESAHDVSSYPSRLEVDLKPNVPQHDTLPHVVTLPELRHHAEAERYLPYNNSGTEPAPRAYPSTSPFTDDPDDYYQHQYHHQHHHRQEAQQHEQHQQYEQHDQHQLQPLHHSYVLPPIETSYGPHVHELFQPTARHGARGAHGSHGASAHRYPDHITFWESTIPSPPAPAPLSAGLAQYQLTRPQH